MSFIYMHIDMGHAEMSVAFVHPQGVDLHSIIVLGLLEMCLQVGLYNLYCLGIPKPGASLPYLATSLIGRPSYRLSMLSDANSDKKKDL